MTVEISAWQSFRKYISAVVGRVNVSKLDVSTSPVGASSWRCIDESSHFCSISLYEIWGGGVLAQLRGLIYLYEIAGVRRGEFGIFGDGAGELFGGEPLDVR